MPRFTKSVEPEKNITSFRNLGIDLAYPGTVSGKSDMNVKAYAKYLLEEGTLEEKRDLLQYLKGKLAIEDKKVRIE